MKIIFETALAQKVGEWNVPNAFGCDMDFCDNGHTVLVSGRRFEVVGSRGAHRPGDDPFSRVKIVWPIDPD